MHQSQSDWYFGTSLSVLPELLVLTITSIEDSSKLNSQNWYTLVQIMLVDQKDWWQYTSPTGTGAYLETDNPRAERKTIT